MRSFGCRVFVAAINGRGRNSGGDKKFVSRLHTTPSHSCLLLFRLMWTFTSRTPLILYYEAYTLMTDTCATLVYSIFHNSLMHHRHYRAQSFNIHRWMKTSIRFLIFFQSSSFSYIPFSINILGQCKSFTVFFLKHRVLQILYFLYRLTPIFYTYFYFFDIVTRTSINYDQ